MSKRILRESVRAKGFFRLQIAESRNGKDVVVGDSGWKKNLITNLGFQNFIVGSLGAIAGSSQVSYVALGTGGAPAATDTTLAGEVMASTQRVTVSPSAVSSKTAQFTAAFLSANSFVTTTYNISNVGLFATTNTNATLFAGNTYTSSLLNTNQNVNVTYQIRFS
jgi:hypothetical protein